MPQARESLRKKFLKDGDDGIEKCEAILKKHGIPIKGNGLIVIPDAGVPDAPKELEEAVEYLCDEWDYGLISESEAAEEK